MKRLREKEISSLAESKKGRIILPSLPEDIIMAILSMLPVKSIIRFRCVCKLWLELFKNPGFIRMHLNHTVESKKFNVFLTALFGQEPFYYRVDFDAASATSSSNKIELPISSVQYRLCTRRRCVGSYNGILCFSCRHSYSGDLVAICLWNPSTQEYKEIPVEESCICKGHAVEYGFGYDCKIDDYKLVLIHNVHYGSLSEIHIYTLRSNSWKTIRNTPCVYSCMCSSKLLNGAMHWATRKIVVTDDGVEVNNHVIVSFDLAEEKTKEIQIPSCLSDVSWKLRNPKIGVLGKDLYLSVCGSNIFELWVMKDYGVVDSWTKLISNSTYVKTFYSAKLLCFNKNCEILFECQGDRPYENGLVSYDLRNGIFTFLNINDMPESFTAETYIGSLISLH